MYESFSAVFFSSRASTCASFSMTKSMPMPPPSRKWYGWPMASGMTRMSENSIAASRS